MPGRLLVRAAPGASAAAVSAAINAAGGRETERLDALGVRVVTVPEDRLTAALRALNAAPAVWFAEPDVVVEATERVPNDALYRYQWGAEQVSAPRAWSRTVGDAGVTIAVLDTGVDAAHEDLQDAVVAGYDFVNADADPADDQGHGTLAAGVAAARSDNLLGIAGLCWRCTILSVKVLDNQGQGSTSTIAEGIRYAADQGAEVINLSLGSTQRSNTLALAVNYANERGALLVASAGNAGTTEIVYPAGFEGVIGVAGNDESGARYTWSSYGNWVDVAAPGCNPATDYDPTRRYSWFCGTSSAAPLVSGIAGLAFSRFSGVSNGDVWAALRTGTVPVDYVETGRVNADAVLAALEPGSGTSPPPAPVEPVTEPTDDTNPIEPEPTPGTTTERAAGFDRYETAARVSRQAFPNGVERVYLATGAAFPDALSGGAAAAATGSPVLITASASLPEAIRDELRRLAPAETIVVGGEAAVRPAVAEAVAEVTGTPVRRIAGADRYATAAAVARAAFGSGVGTLYVATGATFADALAGVPAAAAENAPLLLTAPASLPPVTADAIAALDPARIVVLGGPAAISDAVVDELGAFAPVERVAGADRFATSTAVAERAFPGGVPQTLIATGFDFPDALVGGPAAAVNGGSLLLVQPDRLPEVVAGELRRSAPHTVLALGGHQVVSQATLEAAAEAASAGTPE